MKKFAYYTVTSYSLFLFLSGICFAGVNNLENGKILYKSGRYREALIVFKAYLKKVNKEESQILFYIASCHEVLGKYDTAEKELRRAIAADSENAEARYKLIYYLKRKGQIDEAIFQLKESARIVEQQTGVKLDISKDVEVLERLKKLNIYKEQEKDKTKF